jgi:hypothetical protein
MVVVPPPAVARQEEGMEAAEVRPLSEEPIKLPAQARKLKVCSRHAARGSHHRRDSEMTRRGGERSRNQTLKRKSMTSPSFTTYSLPSDLTTPFSRDPFHPELATNSSYPTVSARMNPRSKSV